MTNTIQCAILLSLVETVNTKKVMMQLIVDSKQRLIDLVIEQIREDVNRNTIINLDTLLWDVDDSLLEEYLSDEKLQEFKNNEVR